MTAMFCRINNAYYVLQFLFVGYFKQREDEVGLDVSNVFCIRYCKSKEAALCYGRGQKNS